MKHDLNLRHLKAVALIADSGSSHAAAATAGVSQPAISQALKRVETQFGVSIFDRSGTGMRLNAEGLIVNLRIRRMFDALAQMRRRINGARRGQKAVRLENLVTMTHLRAVLAVANNRGFSAAARHMGISVPSVHRATRELEDIIGTKLFDRLNYGVEPTPLGADVARLSGLALREIDAAFEDLLEARGFERGKVVVGAQPLARTDILPNAIAELCRRMPEAEVEIIEGEYEILVHALRRGELDIMIGALRGKARERDVQETPLLEDSLSIMARAGHPLAGRGDISVAELARYPWVIPRRGAPTRVHFEKLFDGRPPPGLVESSSLVVIRALLAASDRLTLMSRRRILYEEQMGLLTALPVPLHFTARKVGITTRANWHPTRMQGEFLTILRQQLDD
ncbi:MAG: LysR family transcriptional regulator [Ahrensia sp.]|nr:LysR family transcriptional regulator [Ahrensia sp.]